MSPPKKRVLFLVPSFSGGVGGAERVVSTLLRHLDHSRFECHLALVQARHACFEDIGNGVVVHHLNVSRMRYALPAIVRVAWRIRPQTILSTVSYLNVMLIVARPLLPAGTRVLLREATTPSAFVGRSARHPRLWTWLYRHLYKHADKIVCLSDSMCHDLAEHFGVPPQKLVRIYNPVDIARLRHLARAEENPFHDPGPHLVVAGRLRAEKGVDVLLDSMPVVARRFPSVRLTILGEGPLDALLKVQAARLGLTRHVSFLGFQNNPWPWLGHADLFVLPSRLEGLPNALLEALALGTFVVATTCVGAMREIQEGNPQMLLVESEAPDALAHGIITALDNAKRGGRFSGPSTAALQKFDLPHVVREYSRLL